MADVSSPVDRQLTFESLAEFKAGLVQRMLSAALNRMAIDVDAAPDINEARKVTLEITARPVVDEGELSDVIIEFSVGGKVPKRVTSGRMRVKKTARGDKQFFFNLDSPDSPDQRPLPFEQK